MKPTTELKQAVKEYRMGRVEAFTALYEESSKYIYTCIYKIMGGNDNVADAICDIMQDTYVEISKNISQLDNEDSFLSWAGTIATRKCYAWLKKNKKYVLLHEEDDTFDNLADDDNVIPEEVMQNREKQRIIREIIDKELTEIQRLCIVAYYYNEQKQSEIARELGIPENTVKTNLLRAKAKIKTGVLEVEEKQGTRLYSFAPFMLLLFREEISACGVPAAVTEGVKTAVSAAGQAGAKTRLGKMAAASAKAKITAGIIGIGVLGTIGGIIYVTNQPEEQPYVEESTQEMETSENEIIQSEPAETEQRSEAEIDIMTRLEGDSWEKYYARALLSPETQYVAFDLHDFDGDGMPELVTKTKSGMLSINSFHDIVSIPYPVSADSVGYGEKPSELISIYVSSMEDGTDMSSVYVFDNFEVVEIITPSRVIVEDNYTYDVEDKDYNSEELSYEEGLQRIQAWQEKYQKIDFKPIEQDIVIGFIEAHSTNGKLLDD